jgi:ABC-type transport system involved in multi-copper enzyme maturation permease subunit
MLGPIWTQIALRSSRRGWLLLLRYAYLVGQLLLYLILIHPFLIYHLLLLLASLLPFCAPLLRTYQGWHPDPDGDFVAANLTFLQLWPWLQALVTVGGSVPLIAGEITDEKERGTLALLLTTPLEPGHILGGKLLGRGAQLLTLLLTGLPLYCYALSWAGLPLAICLVEVVVLALRVYAVGALALLASTRSRSTRAAVVRLLAVLLVLLPGLLGARWGLEALDAAGEPVWAAALARAALVPVRFAVDGLDPLALLRLDEPGALGSHLVRAALCYTVPGTLCLVLAVWRLRPEYVRQLEQPGVGGGGSWRRRPALGDRPVHWREQYVTGLASGVLPRWLPPVVAALTSAGLAWVAFGILNSRALTLRVGGMVGFVTVAMGGTALLAGVRACGLVTGERERGTWEPLLLTPLSAAGIVEEKFHGTLRACLPLVFAFTVPAFVAALVAGAHISWLVVLAVLPGMLWFVLRWMIAVGLSASAESKSSWRSLWATLAFGFLIGSQVGGSFLTIAWGLTALVATFLAAVMGPGTPLASLEVLPLVVLGGLTGIALEWFGRRIRRSAAERVAAFERVLQRRRLPPRR